MKKTALKRTGFKRRKKTPRQKAEEKIWELCKQIVKLREGNSCYTCDQTNLEGANWHIGHGKPKGALQLRYQYDTRNLKSQCMRCNYHLGGMTDIFLTKLEQEKEGLEFLKEACVKTERGWEIKHGNPMGSAEAMQFLEDKIFEYSEILEQQDE